jgi:hypothetical protein
MDGWMGAEGLATGRDSSFSVWAHPREGKEKVID